ncbi:MAG: toll/interleukin-1 receptor domain-containing protein [Bacteroidales bacterium]
MFKIDRYLKLLAAAYKEEGEEELERIVVNAIVLDETMFDSQYCYHKIIFSLPKSIYLRARRRKSELENRLYSDLSVEIVENTEVVQKITLTMIDDEDEEWREKSGALLSENPIVLPSIEKQIWGESPLRVFFSYTAKNLELISHIKDQLGRMGIFCFMAEKDIQTTKSWADTIKNALSSMEIMVAFLTEDYHESDWTDQELGFAICRNVPIISIDLGKKPYGFASQFQAFSCDTKTLANHLFLKLTELDEEHGEELQLIGAIYSLKNAQNFEEANLAALHLFRHKKLSDKQVKDVVDAYNSNSQVREANEIIGKTKPIALILFLNEVTGQEYHLNYGILSIKE